MHDSPLGGHLGMNRTYNRMKLFTTWPGMKQELEEYIRQCQKKKITQNKTKLPMKITTTPEIVWEKCTLDIIGPLNQTVDGHVCFDISGRAFKIYFNCSNRAAGHHDDSWGFCGGNYFEVWDPSDYTD